MNLRTLLDSDLPDSASVTLGWLVVTDGRDVFLERLRPVWIQGVGA